MRTLVLHPVRSKGADRDPKDALAEAVSLAGALDLDVVGAEAVPLPRARAGMLFGKGKVEELAALIAEREVGLVIIDGPLSPVQQRNLEKAWKAKVLDRTGLILEIFGDRAQTREGVLQVELAHLSYQKSRLVRSLDPPRAAARRLRLPRRPRRDADRGRPPRARRAHPADQAGAGQGGADPRAAPQGAAAGAVSGGGAGRLHQRRQVDAVQPADRLRRAGQGHALRHARPDHAGDCAAGRAQGDPRRTRWGSSRTCRRSWWRRSAPRSRRCWRRT